MNYMFFDGGPLAGQKVVTTGPVDSTFESNGGRYVRVKQWAYVRGIRVHLFKVAE